MIPELKRRSYGVLAGGLLLHAIGLLLRATESELLAGLGTLILFLGFGVFVWGCIQYAQGKGYSKSVGAWGLLWIAGFIVLAFLPNKTRVATDA